MSDDLKKLGLWAAHQGDQIAAAIEQHDLAHVGHLGVEAYLRAADIDCPGDDEVSFAYALAGLNGLHPQHLLVVAAEAMRRLCNERRGR